ncbi:MAG: thioredoxin [Romboutsia timonensis]|uniref:thioredoxin n=1 Tax=Romboutsia timonensis TaxID=1776391 RepID=UPI002A759CAE|nr:thioredoxin [Romboutsia timonensis]MDY2883515.1 thioredoxin [Romboutsia timonensis]
MAKIINTSQFRGSVEENQGVVVVDFFATWCGPCKMLAPIVDEIAQENDDIKVAKVNVDENPNIALDYKVMSIPTLVVIKGGKEVSRSVGVVDKKEILEMLSK